MSNAGYDIDHTSFAVHDAMAWARRLRREWGATPICGEVLPDFRYLLLYVGTDDDGARLELLEPAKPGFLTRFLSTRGEGPHHLTFSVPDLRDAVERLRALGVNVVGENYDHAPWREAFVMPDGLHGVVIQIAQSDRAYPGAGELLASQEREPEALPSAMGAQDPLWWAPLWDTPPGALARLGATHLASTDLTVSRTIFEGVLGGRCEEGEDSLLFSWPSGSLRVRRGDRPGVRGVSLSAGAEGLMIGRAWLGEAEPNRED